VKDLAVRLGNLQHVSTKTLFDIILLYQMTFFNYCLK
jgi:hypothetical protein